MPPKKKSSKSKKTIPEDFELSDDEPKMVSLSQEQKLTSKILSLIALYVRENYS